MEENLSSYISLLQLILENQLFQLSGMENEFLLNAYGIIEDNLNNSMLSVGYLAANLAVSKSTLNRKLLALTGMSANEFIKQYRLQKAAILLSKGSNVSETAYLSGFETPSYFTQSFKEFYKITPKKYSKENLPVNFLFKNG